MKAEYLEISGRTYYAFEDPELGECEKLEKPLIGAVKTSGLDEKATEQKRGFWRRQFQAEVTTGQRKFDWLFGVITPVICFFFDPIVFAGHMNGRPIFGGYKTFAYLLSFSAIMAVMACLLFGEKLKWLNVAVAGLLTVGGIAGAFVALVITPFSLLGIIFYLVGVLGLTAWVTSFVLLRNAVRSFRAAKPHFEPLTLKHSWMLSGIFSAVIPYLFNVWMR